MATYFIASGGSNTAPYDTWAKAATSIATALAAATADADFVVLQYNAVPAGDAEVAADTSYTFAGNITFLSASNDGGSAYTPTAMGTANWIGNSTTNRFVAFVGADRRVRVWGITVRIAGSTLDDVRFGNTTSGANYEFENCYFWNGNSATGAAFQVGGGGYGMMRFISCTFRFGATGQTLQFGSAAELQNCTISSSGSTPTALVGTSASACRGPIDFRGCDLSLITGTLVGNCEGHVDFNFDRCKLGAAVTILASQTTNPTEDSANVTIRDCASGDNHVIFSYHNALGSATIDTSIYYTGTPAGSLSWKLVTSANVKSTMPFVAPLIPVYHTGTSAITPYIEVLRDGSTTPYTDAELWAETLVKNTSGSTLAGYFSDRTAIGAAAANQASGAGTGSWTGEAGSAWSGKVDSGASVTPAENGHISMVVCFAAASATVYVDPVIRT